MKYIEFQNVIVSDTWFQTNKNLSILSYDDIKMLNPVTINNNGNIFTGDVDKVEIFGEAIQELKNPKTFNKGFSLIWYSLVDYSKVKNVEPIIYKDEEHYTELNEKFVIDIFNGDYNGRPRLRYKTLNKNIYMTIYELTIETNFYKILSEFEYGDLHLDINDNRYIYNILDTSEQPLTLNLQMTSKNDKSVDGTEESFIIPLYDQYIEKIDPRYAFWTHDFISLR